MLTKLSKRKRTLRLEWFLFSMLIVQAFELVDMAQFTSRNVLNIHSNQEKNAAGIQYI